MMLPLPTENVITGAWLFNQGEVVSDNACKRIEHLTRDVFNKLALSREFGAWEILYVDPHDQRLWELTFPQGELQGGGPPQLAVIGENQARSKYDY